MEFERKEYLQKLIEKIIARDLAEAVGVTPGMISHYELDWTKEIPDEMLEKISEVLDCSVDDLIQGDPRYDGSSIVTINQSEDLEDRFYAEKLVQLSVNENGFLVTIHTGRITVKNLESKKIETYNQLTTIDQ